MWPTPSIQLQGIKRHCSANGFAPHLKLYILTGENPLEQATLQPHVTLQRQLLQVDGATLDNPNEWP